MVEVVVVFFVVCVCIVGMGEDYLLGCVVLL